MGNHVRSLENVDERRMLMENPEAKDGSCVPTSDESGSDDDAVLDIQNVQLDETERAILERLSCGPCKRAGDSHIGTPAYFGLPTLDGVFDSFHNEQEILAMQAQVSGSRVMARRVPVRLPEKEVIIPCEIGYESPLFNSCFKALCEMTDGAFREECPDLMEFLTEELTQVQKRQKVLITFGSEAGYGSPEFQRAVEVWRSSLDMATDPGYQAEQVNNVWGAVTFEKTVERLRNPLPEEPEPTTTRKDKKRKYADPPLVDVYRRACERLTMELLDGAVRTHQPLLLLELLLEDIQHVQRRQQALFRAELAAALQPPTQQVERVTCNDGSSKSILTAGGISIGESLNPMPQLVPNPVSGELSPFTASQWVELEHQALIFKYMVAGVRLMNVPDEVLDPIRKSVASTNGTVSHHAPNLGSGAFHLGVANNTDPEPGRCRRTDGKKWRCAHDVVPDKKYCERHVHRGRHRSRPAASSGQLQLQASQ